VSVTVRVAGAAVTETAAAGSADTAHACGVDGCAASAICNPGRGFWPVHDADVRDVGTVAATPCLLLRA
jgi:hypothetical protein